MTTSKSGNAVEGASVGVNERPRPSFEEIYLELARTLAHRSTYHRLRVGTVITSTDYRKVLAVGYNGNATGLPNRCDREEPGNCGCLHSEENAVINCDSPRSVEKIAFVTHLPCTACAQHLENPTDVIAVGRGLLRIHVAPANTIEGHAGFPVAILFCGNVALRCSQVLVQSGTGVNDQAGLQLARHLVHPQ
jgi:dCMP deaminase